VRELSHDFKGVIFFQIFVGLLRSDPGSSSEICLMSFDGESQVSGIKVEVVADTKEEGEPHPITFRKIRAESEVSFMLM
jgi:hypothetical protein